MGPEAGWAPGWCMDIGRCTDRERLDGRRVAAWVSSRLWAPSGAVTGSPRIRQNAPMRFALLDRLCRSSLPSVGSSRRPAGSTGGRANRRSVAVTTLVTVGLLAAACGSASSSSASAGASSGHGAPAASGSASSRGAGSTLSLQATTASWTLPAAGSRQVVCWNGSQLVELGGLVPGDVSTAAVETIDPTTGAVQAAGQLAHAAHDAAGACLGGGAVVFGGGTVSSVAAVQRWSPSGSQVISSLPSPRSDLAAAVVGSDVYLVGGYSGTTLASSILRTTTGTSFAVAGQLQVPVRYPAVAAGDGSVWIAGGETGVSGGQTDVIQRFDPSTGTTTVVGHLPAPLADASGVFLGGQFFVVGGVTGSTTTDQIWAVDPTTGAVRAAGTLPMPLSNAGTAVVGNTAYLLGGEGTAGPSAPLDTVVELRAGHASSGRAAAG